MSLPVGLDAARLQEVTRREQEAFRGRIPKSLKHLADARKVMPDGVPMSWMAGLYAHPPIFVAGGQGSRFEDVDGNSYIDFNLADLSNTIGYGVNAVSERLAVQAKQGIQHLLPTTDAIAVCEELYRRTGYPFWQFTATALGANTEVIRIARAFTKRAKIVVFEGKYHGHVEATMVEGAKPEAMGILDNATRDSVEVPFNDIEALRRVLEADDVALVMTEPVLTNCSLVLADKGFIAEVGALCKAHRTLLCIDETHSWQFAFGGLTRAERIRGDFLTLGKGLGTGATLGCYGMSAELSTFLEEHLDYGKDHERGLAIGGTTYGNALAMAAVHAGLSEIMTEAGYRRISIYGQRLSSGIEDLIVAHGLPWQAFHYGPRSGICVTPQLPRSVIEAGPSMDLAYSAARRVFMANRGVWDAIYSAGPQVSFAHSEADVDTYLAVLSDFLAEVVASPAR